VCGIQLDVFLGPVTELSVTCLALSPWSLCTVDHSMELLEESQWSGICSVMDGG
jgi:hypothetical protein